MLRVLRSMSWRVGGDDHAGAGPESNSRIASTFAEAVNGDFVSVLEKYAPLSSRQFDRS